VSLGKKGKVKYARIQGTRNKFMSSGKGGKDREFRESQKGECSRTVINTLLSYAFTIMNNIVMRKGNEFLLLYLILFKRVNFRQHTSSAGAKEY